MNSLRKENGYIDRFVVKHMGAKDTNLHHIYFKGIPDDNIKIRYGLSSDPKHTDAGTRAHKMARDALKAFQKDDCGLATFYLGQMTHYIADVSQFMHLIPKGMSEHGGLEDTVAKRTCGRLYGDGGKRERNWDKRNLK